jgi:hypothetical protein
MFLRKMQSAVALSLFVCNVDRIFVAAWGWRPASKKTTGQQAKKQPGKQESQSAKQSKPKGKLLHAQVQVSERC